MQARAWEAMGEAVDQSELLRFYGRPLKPAEIACFLSHFQAWKRALDTGILRDFELPMCLSLWAEISLLLTRLYMSS